MRGQSVNVTGIISIGDKPPKEVIKRDGRKGLVKECVIEDNTGQTQINVWEDLIGKFENGTNLMIKNYSGDTFLGANKGTTFF